MLFLGIISRKDVSCFNEGGGGEGGCFSDRGSFIFLSRGGIGFGGGGVSKKM